MQTKDLKREQAIELLVHKSKEISGLPKKSDFTQDEIILIKAKLGPWPRALEEAGLKEPPQTTAKDKNIKKRKQARKRRKQSE